MSNLDSFEKRKEAFFKEYMDLVNKHKINIGTELSFDKNSIKPFFVFIDTTPTTETTTKDSLILPKK